MNEVSFHGLDIGTIEGDEDLIEEILEAADRECPLQDGDILVITSKVVSLVEDRVRHLEEVDPSRRAEAIGSVTGIDPREVQLIIEDADLIGTLPLKDIVGDRIYERAADEDLAEEALEEMPSLLITERNGRLCTNAGVDLSNTPENIATLLPEDPDASARRLRERLEERTGKDLAVVLADSEVKLQGATVDIATGCSGIQAVDRKFGTPDLYGQPKIGGVDMIVDELCSAAALLFGQADERTAVVVVRGMEYSDGEGIERNSELLGPGLRKTFWQTLVMKVRERLPF